MRGRSSSCAMSEEMMLMVMRADEVRSENIRRNAEFGSRLGEFERVKEGSVRLQNAIVFGSALRRVCVECTIVVDVKENGVDGVQAGRQIRFYMST